jgi:ATP-dependent RNA helicase DOB1
MAEAEELRRKADSLIGENHRLEEYVQARKEAKEARKLISQSVVQPDICLHVLRPGRIIRINALDVDWGYGVLLCVQRLEEGAPSDPKSYIVDVMLSCKLDAGRTVPCSIEDKEASMLVLPVALTFITEISTLRISLPESLKTTKNKNSVRNTLKSLIKKYPLKLPELDPINDLGLSGKQADLVVNALANEDKALEILRSLEANGKDGKKTPQQLNEAAEMQYTARKKELETSTSPINKFEEEFKQRKDILRKLGHIDMEDTVTLKESVLVSIA